MEAQKLYHKQLENAGCLNLPVSYNNGEELEELEVHFPRTGRVVYFKLEELPWHINRDELLRAFDGNTVNEKLMRLEAALNEYTRGWEIARIYTPAKDAKAIRVLFKKETP